jgi:hypothetical protein
LLIDPNAKRNCWPKARVTKVYPDLQGIIHKVEVTKANGLVTNRAVSKIIRISPRWGEKIPEEDVTSEEKVPVRRSPRIKSKLSLINLIMVIMIFLPSLEAKTDTHDKTATQVKSLPEGFAVFEKGIMLSRSGTFRVHVDTNIKLEENQNNIEQHINSLKNQCAKLPEFSWKVCNRHVDRLNEEFIKFKILQYTILEDAKVERKRGLRVKREFTGTGLIPWLADILIGWKPHVEPPTHLKGAAGVIKHEAYAIKALQDLQNSANKRTLDNLQTLETAIEEHQQSWAKSDAEMKISIQLDTTSEAILQLMKHMAETFDPSNMDSQEWIKIIEKINQELTGSYVPKIGLEQLKDLMNWSYQIEQEMQFVVDIPVVYNTTFRNIQIIPVPDEEASRMPDTTPVMAIIDGERKTYVLEEDIHSVIPINNTMSIIDIAKQRKISKMTPCAITSILTQKITCSTRKIQPKEDIWIETVMHNTYAFVSKVQHTEICINKKYDIAEQAGLIVLEQGCEIHTPNFIIQSKADYQLHHAHMYHIENNFQDNINVAATITPKHIQLNTKLTESHLADNLIKEAESVVDTENDNLWKYIAIGSGGAFFALLIITITIYKISKNCANNPVQAQRSYEQNSFQLVDRPQINSLASAHYRTNHPIQSTQEDERNNYKSNQTNKTNTHTNNNIRDSDSMSNFSVFGIPGGEDCIRHVCNLSNGQR